MNNKRYFYLTLLVLITSVLSTCNVKSQNSNCEKKDTLNYITTQYGCLFIKVFKSDSVAVNPNLLIVIHGDAPFNPPSYQYKLSQKLSKLVKNTIIVSVLRPGYKDNEGNKSDGKKGLTTGDNYTQEVVNSLTEVIKELKSRFKPSKTIIIGHSGGAAISADVVSLSSSLVDELILVSCPCDVEEFRKSMALKQPFYRAWRDSVKSISPMDVVEKLNKNANIILIHGRQDDIVPFQIIKSYETKLKIRNIKTQLIVIENEGHEIFLSDAVFASLRKSLEAGTE